MWCGSRGADWGYVLLSCLRRASHGSEGRAGSRPTRRCRSQRTTQPCRPPVVCPAQAFPARTGPGGCRAAWPRRCSCVPVWAVPCFSAPLRVRRRKSRCPLVGRPVTRSFRVRVRSRGRGGCGAIGPASLAQTHCKHCTQRAGAQVRARPLAPDDHLVGRGHGGRPHRENDKGTGEVRVAATRTNQQRGSGRLRRNIRERNRSRRQELATTAPASRCRRGPPSRSWPTYPAKSPCGSTPGRPAPSPDRRRNTPAARTGRDRPGSP